MEQGKLSSHQARREFSRERLSLIMCISHYILLNCYVRVGHFIPVPGSYMFRPRGHKRGLTDSSPTCPGSGLVALSRSGVQHFPTLGKLLH